MTATDRDDREHLAGVIKGWARQGGVGYDTLADAILHSEWLRRHDAAVTARAHAPIRALADKWKRQLEAAFPLDAETGAAVAQRRRDYDDLRAALDPAAATQHDTEERPQ